MKQKSLLQVTCSLIVAILLVVTSITISPQVTLAQDNSNPVLELLNQGIELQEQGDIAQAQSLYQEVIDLMEQSESMDNFLLAQSGLIETQFSLGEISATEANRLLEQFRTGYADLKDQAKPECGECQSGGQSGYRLRNRCKKCSV